MPITLTYPVTLPLPTVQQSYSNQPGTGADDPNAGIPVNFKRTDANFYTFNLSFRFDQDQLTEFLDFFYNDLLSGTKWFLLKLPIGVDTAGQLREQEVNFNSNAPSYTNNGKRRNVSATVQVRNVYRDRLDFTESYLDLLQNGDPIPEFLDRLEIFANVDLPENLAP